MELIDQWIIDDIFGRHYDFTQHRTVVYVPYDPNKIPSPLKNKIKSQYPNAEIHYSKNLFLYQQLLNKSGLLGTMKIPYLYVDYRSVKKYERADDNPEFKDGLPLDKQISFWKKGLEVERRVEYGEDFLVYYPAKLDYYSVPLTPEIMKQFIPNPPQPSNSITDQISSELDNITKSITSKTSIYEIIAIIAVILIVFYLMR